MPRISFFFYFVMVNGVCSNTSADIQDLFKPYNSGYEVITRRRVPESGLLTGRNDVKVTNRRRWRCGAEDWNRKLNALQINADWPPQQNTNAVCSHDSEYREHRKAGR
jgi:hypothetical protein